MKIFIYNVGAKEFIDNKAFGKAWKDAKEYAIKRKTYITRRIIKGNKMREEFFAKGGVFLSIDRMNNDNLKIFC